MTAKERDKDIAHWEKIVKKCENECCKYDNSRKCSDIRQQIHYAEFRINQIREEWRKSKLSTLN